ncbi:MAG: hypothetical protein ABSA93_05020 [Streptosporangiaceae bacterium]|jgi:hypothetical protein
MKSGNPVSGANAHGEGIRERSTSDRGPSRQVRDIQEIIAKLEVVTKRLAYPLRNMPQPRRSSVDRSDEPDMTDGGAPGN